MQIHVRLLKLLSRPFNVSITSQEYVFFSFMNTTRHTYDTINVGDSFSFTRRITEEDVRKFAEVTGDDNPIHLDEEYARKSRFGGTVVHGVLLLGVISKVLGRDFPGPGSIAVSISCNFLRPVPVGSEVTTEVRIIEKIERHRHLRARVHGQVNGKLAMRGEAVLIPPPPEEA